MHGVTCMEELKLPMLLYAYTGRQRYLDLDGLPSHARNGVLLGECPPLHAQFRHLHVAARPGGSHCRSPLRAFGRGVRLPDDRTCRIEQRTSYPFDGEIEFVFSMKGKAEIPFQLRIPGWCDGASIRINGKPWKGECPRGSFVTIRRKFRDDGRIRLHLGMEPAGAWNYALCPETGCKPKVVRTQTAAQVGYPFDRESVPVKVRVPVKRIDWMLEEGRYTPRLPEGGKARAISDDIEYLELIPYGCTELRLTVFPVVE